MKMCYLKFCLATALVALFGVACDSDDDNPARVDNSARVEVEVSFTGAVSEESPLVVELKENKLDDPEQSRIVTENGSTVSFDNITPGKYLIAVWYDQDNDGVYDLADEPLVFYSAEETDRSVSIFEDATHFQLNAGENLNLTTITFSPKSD